MSAPLRTTMHGTETSTLELEATLEVRVPSPFLPTGEGSLLFFSMQRLALDLVPWVGLAYREALWRVGVTLDGAKGWLALTCDLDSALVAAMGRRVIRYSTRSARFEGEWAVETAAGAISVRSTPSGTKPPPEPPRRTFVLSGGRPYEIPWAEEPAPARERVIVEVRSDSLSAATFGAAPKWRREGLAHHGRVHRCGAAQPLGYP